ncbi:hypothetical protein [Nocardia sp. NBC_01327]|uniref:hypothetical protein n=1 Tax=Nocardia sp. NBC_01327 TaxID=2903593 RepID=UPI002E144BF4|nr:hypothetical protein OG326_26430 [Nocardia sp. NBC_01327]
MTSIEQRLVSPFRTVHPNSGAAPWNSSHQRRYLQAQYQTAAVAIASSALAGAILTLGVLPGL